MEIRQLKYFIAAAEQLNFTKAAQKCSIVQTAMTQQIANLEGELGVKLFERNHHNLALTAAGEHFLKNAKRIVVSAEAAVSEIGDYQQGYENVIRIGYHGEMFKQDLTRCLRLFRETHPETKVYLKQEPQDSLIESLENGELDLIFTVYGSFLETLDWMEIMILDESELCLVVSRTHSLAERESVCWAELKDEVFVDFEEKNRDERELDLIQNGVLLNHYGNILDHTSGEILIDSGYAVGMWVSRMCSTQQYPNLRFPKISDSFGKVKSCLLCRKDMLGTPGREFVSLAQSVCDGRVRE